MIVVLGTGGTIAGMSANPRKADNYQAAQIQVDALLESIVEGPTEDIQCEQLMQVDSKDMDHASWQLLAYSVSERLKAPAVTGVVVTHGTDTLEETAYFLQRLLSPSKPVVLAAAMRPANALLADGPQNLLDALCVARQTSARGVVAVVGGAVFHPVGMRKWHSSRLDAFSGGDSGPIGVVEFGRFRRFREWPVGTALGLDVIKPAPGTWPRVEIVMNHVAADGRLVDMLSQSGVEGIVVAGTGNGSVSVKLEQSIRRAAARGVAIRYSTRCAAGRVSRTLANDEWEELTPVQTRVELLLALLGRRHEISSSFGSAPRNAA